MERVKTCLLAVITYSISWVVYYLLIDNDHMLSPAFYASAIIFSVFFHELGHMLMMEKYGIHSRMFFLVILGGAFPADTKKNSIDTLSANQYCAVLLAGVTGNALVIVSAMASWSVGLLEISEMLCLINLNSILIFFNLIPISILDGGRFAKRFFDSVPEHLDFRYAFSVLSVIFITLLVIHSITGGVSTFGVGLIVYGLYSKSVHDDPHGSSKKDALTESERRFWLVYYCIMFIVGIVGSQLTPHWLS